jgi:phosphopantetheine adenylyltransferase
MINAERKKNGLQELEIWEVGVVGGEGLVGEEMKKGKVGSGRIREWRWKKGEREVEVGKTEDRKN